MTDPWSELDAYRADVTRLARPIPLAELRRRARRRRSRQIAGVVGAVALIIGSVGVGVGYGAGQRRAEPGPATQHTTPPGPTSTPLTPTSPTTPPTPSIPTTPTGRTDPTTPTTSTLTGTPAGHGRRYDDIPADYPWLTFVQDLGGDGFIEGPGERVELPKLDPCGRRTWNPQRLVAQLTLSTNFPEFSQRRQIVIFPDAAAAQRALDGVRSAFSRCPIHRSGHGFAIRYVVSPPTAAGPTTPAGGGTDAWLAVSAQQRFQGAPALGLEEMRWARLANTVIYTYDYGEAQSDYRQKGRQVDRMVSRMLDTWCRLAGGC